LSIFFFFFVGAECPYSARLRHHSHDQFTLQEGWEAPISPRYWMKEAEPLKIMDGPKSEQT